MTPNFEKVKEKLKEVKCFGGFDYCEDVVEALKATVEINWTRESNFRIIVLMTDSPPHGESYHQKLFDDYPEKDQEFDNLEECVRKLVKMKIAILSIEIDERTQIMNKIMEKICKREKGRFQKVIFNDLKDPKYLKQFFENEVINELDLIFRDQWNFFLENKIKENINWDMQIDFNNLTLIQYDNEISSKWIANITKEKVLEGNLRNIHLLFTEKNHSKYVVKLPKDGSFNLIEELFDNWKNYSVAVYLAEEFKSQLEKNGINLKNYLQFSG